MIFEATWFNKKEGIAGIISYSQASEGTFHTDRYLSNNAANMGGIHKHGN